MANTYYSKEIHTEGNPIKSLFAKEYEDPRDAFYLEKLKLNKGFDKLVKLAFEYGVERANLILYTGASIRITDKNMPYLYECINKACEILDVEQVPQAYVVQDPYLNAMTIGSKNPILVLNDSIIERTTHEELMYIIGHEIGHIKSEHCQYLTIGSYLEFLLKVGVESIPYVGQILSTGITLAYYDWARKAEFTADHAGFLVCQDLKAAVSALAKLGGYPREFYDTMNIDSFVEQAREFEDLEDKPFNKLLKLYLTAYMDHPWAVLRAKELLLWVQSGAYSKIILRNSDYLKTTLEKLEATADRAKQRHERLLGDADRAQAEREEAIAKENEEPQETGEKLTGAKALIARGQKELKSLQDKLDDSNVKRKRENAEAAETSMERAAEDVAIMKKIYVDASQEDIDAHISETMGDITPIC